MPTSPRPALLRAQRSNRLIVFRDRFEDQRVRGYVAAVGPVFFSLAVEENAARFNGFSCYRIADVRALAPQRYAEFTEAALRKRGVRIPKWRRIDISSLGALLVSANRQFPLITVHRERVLPGCCDIGRVTELGRHHVSMLLIDPGAVWDEQPERIMLNQITRVDFGGEYEESLHMIGGAPFDINFEVQRGS
jgi:hypothetical protein